MTALQGAAVSAPRSLRIDTLRGMAVCGILLVNVWSFVYGGATPRYGVFAAAATGVDHAVVFFVAAFAEQKFYPIFAFLFGAGFALQTGTYRPPGPERDEIGARYRRRIKWLLACGLLHGALVWYGDILTTYAITAFWLSAKCGCRLRQVVESLGAVLMLNFVVMLIGAVLIVVFTLADPQDVEAVIASGDATMLTYTTGSWLDIARLRNTDFGAGLLYGVLFFPRIALFFLLGVFAVRLGWLTRPERHSRLWRKVLAVAICVGLPLNLWWAYVALRESIDPAAPAAGMGVALFLIDLAGPCLAAGYAALVMLASPTALAPLARIFAPVGRIALTNYLTQSILCSLLLQGFGLGLGAVLTHTELFALCLIIMLGQAVFSRYWVAHFKQGPVEALWRRATG